MEEKKKKVVVAFSGGLDTSFTVMYLAKEKGYEVYAACANTGGFSEEQLKTNEENAYKLGATKYVTIDVTQEYYEKSLKYMVFGNVLRNGTYPISVSSERIFQALAIARYANEIGADAIAHGSTGAGNDQIRFDMTFLVLAPNVEIITLTRDMALSRQEEIDYLNKHGFSADFTKLKYSYNLEVKVLLEEPEPMLRQEIEEALADKNYRLARIVSTYRTDVENTEKENENWKRGLQEMSPLQIAQSAFEKIYQVEMPAELTGLFQEAYLAATHKEEEEEE